MACIHSSKGIIPPMGDVQCPTHDTTDGFTGVIGTIGSVSSKDQIHYLNVSGRQIVLKLESKLPEWVRVGVRVDIDFYRGRITKL